MFKLWFWKRDLLFQRRFGSFYDFIHCFFLPKCLTSKFIFLFLSKSMIISCTLLTIGTTSISCFRACIKESDIQSSQTKNAGFGEFHFLIKRNFYLANFLLNVKLKAQFPQPPNHLTLTQHSYHGT